ncbi:MAG: rubrerythrin family protein [Candidatus Thiodiazotropha sp. (ex Dulcina madagascariensis)]|nr:rubrerythrin family protein [Candidatus Thiodiazotropha sp. (ex Dulcina madagascariensis)]
MSKSIKGTQTEKNLLVAFAGESQARNRYTYFSGAARKEGLVQIAEIFEETANQEKEHAKRFFKFLEGGDVEITERFPAGKIGATLENLKAAAAGRVFKRNGKVVWRCRNCGYFHESEDAPKVCPACLHPQAHFELLGENW